MDAPDHTLTIEPRAGYLFVQVVGGWSLEAVRRSIREVAQAAAEHERQRVLIDARSLPEPAKEFDRFLVGESMAEAWNEPIYLKVAIVYPEAFITKFTEDVAVNRGASLLVVSDIEQALAWLMAEGSTGDAT